ncbi:MAG: DUF2871 domain-containing protein [Cellulosilyticaceae bacterium]
MKKYFYMASSYLGLGLIAGVFFREFTKFNHFEDVTTLGKVHGHLLILGFMFSLVLLILEKNFKLSEIKSHTPWLIVYNFSLLYMTTTLLIRGITEVLGTTVAGLSHIAGLGHALLGMSLVWFMVLLYKAISKEA